MQTAIIARTVVQSMRGPFLILAPVCVFLGTSVVIGQRLPVNLPLLVLVLLGALLAHVSVNMLNEYCDLRSGLDLATTRTPFSGGSGALPEHPEAAPVVLRIGVVCLLMTGAIGLLIIARTGWAIAPLGLLGLVIIVLYTPWLNRQPLLCLGAPGLGFGVLMVVGTYVALTGGHAPQVWLAAILPFFLANNLLLINQFPDIKADAAAGRRHLPIVYGTQVAVRIYALAAALAYGSVVAAVALRMFPPLSLLACTTLPLAVIAWQAARKYGPKIGEHPAGMAANVAVTVLTPLLLGLGLALG